MGAGAELLALLDKHTPANVIERKREGLSASLVRQLTDAFRPAARTVPSLELSEDEKRRNELKRRFLELGKGTCGASFYFFARAVSLEHQRGTPLYIIARWLGVSSPTPGNWLKKWGMPITLPPRRPTLVHDGVVYHEGKNGVYLQHRFKQKPVYAHRVIWEQRHGPIPAGFRLDFRGKNKTDFSDENLELISASDFARRLGLSNSGQKRPRKKKSATPD